MLANIVQPVFSDVPSSGCLFRSPDFDELERLLENARPGDPRNSVEAGVGEKTRAGQLTELCGAQLLGPLQANTGKTGNSRVIINYKEISRIKVVNQSGYGMLLPVLQTQPFFTDPDQGLYFGPKTIF
jgi:hypothetical protein